MLVAPDNLLFAICDFNGLDIPDGDYEISLYVKDEIYKYGDKDYLDAGFGNKLKLIVGNPKINSVTPPSGSYGDVITIHGDNLGENPQVFFSSIKAKIVSYTKAKYYVYIDPTTHREAIGRDSSTILFEIPDGAKTPIIVKTECGNVDISPKFNVIPFGIKKIKLELINLNWKYSYSEWNKTPVEKTGVFNFTFPHATNIASFDESTGIVSFLDESSTVTYDHNYHREERYGKMNFTYCKGDVTRGNVSYYYGYFTDKISLYSTEELIVSCSFSNLKKISETADEIIYKFSPNEIDNYLKDFNYNWTKTDVLKIGKSVSFTRSVELLPSDVISEVILTVYKK